MSDRYRRVKVVGKGSFGAAILVRHRQTNKPFIIKEINVSQLSRKEKAEALTEIRVLSQLNHPHIVTYRESFIAEGKLCIVMDFAEKGDLYNHIQQRRGLHFKEDQIWDWFTQLCLSIKHVHDRKILHRDIKTQNVFLTQDNSVQLGDFGIARVLKSTMECAKTAIGTPYYLSPEICEDKPYNNKSDIWSLGCVLYEMTTLRHAFDANNMKGLVLKILRGVYPPIPSHYSNDLRNLIKMMFCRDPKQRPSINAILRLPLMQTKVQKLLSRSTIKSEFCHTVLHNRPSPALEAELPPEIQRLDPRARAKVANNRVNNKPNVRERQQPKPSFNPNPNQYKPKPNPNPNPIPKPIPQSKPPVARNIEDITSEQRKKAFLEQKEAAERNRRRILIDRGILPPEKVEDPKEEQKEAQKVDVRRDQVDEKRSVTPPLSPRERARKILDNIEKERQERHARLRELQNRNNVFLHKKKEELDDRKKHVSTPFSALPEPSMTPPNAPKDGNEPVQDVKKEVGNECNVQELKKEEVEEEQVKMMTLHNDLVQINENNQKNDCDSDSEVVEDVDSDSEEGHDGFKKWLLKKDDLKEAVSKFKNFKNQTIKFDGNFSRQSLGFRIECLQLYLEEKLGLDSLISAHRLLSEFINNSQDDSDDEKFNKEINEILGEHVNFLTLIQQLIYCQFQFNSISI
ncbi:hypothetical protein P9112_008331 [Eukaryota sp. TZLM1-RC]